MECLTADNKEELERMGKVEKQILGPRLVVGDWRLRRNEKLCQKIELSTSIKKGRASCYTDEHPETYDGNESRENNKENLKFLKEKNMASRRI